MPLDQAQEKVLQIPIARRGRDPQLAPPGFPRSQNHMKQVIVRCFPPVRFRRLLVAFFRPSGAISPPLHEAILVDQNDESSTKHIRDCDWGLPIQHLLNRSYRYKRKVDGSTVFEEDSSFPKASHRRRLQKG